MSLFKSIRTAIAQAIAPTTVISTETQADRTSEQQFHSNRVQARVSQYMPEVGHQDVLRGNISVEDIADLCSDYSKNAICSLASWSALAKAFNTYVKNHKDNKMEAFLSEFHAWNAVSPNQMGEEQVMDVLARLTQVSPAKANDQTDAIIARVRKVGVSDLRTEREKKAMADTARREAEMEQFAMLVWNHVFSEHNFEIQAAKAEAKLIDTMQWIANWQSNNPAAQAAELMLLESDLNLVRKMAARDVSNNEGFIDGTLSSDYMMKQNERAA